jgi:predicted transcriptional regulator
VKTAISIPDELFEEADALARRTGKSRSELYADALREHLKRHGDAAITARLNDVYGSENVDPDERRWLDDVAAGIAERNPW